MLDCQQKLFPSECAREFKNKGLFDSKQKRAYGKILTGLKLANREGVKIRFLTLTTSDVQYLNSDYDVKGINDSFRRLKQRFTRQSPYRLMKAGYITRSEMTYFYGHGNVFKCFDFDYFKVATNEGNGVLHIVYKGSYLPYNYLVDNWQDIHNSWDVNIKLIKNSKRDVGRAAAYVVSQYVANQDSSYQRSSMSWHWTVRAHSREWATFKRYLRQQYEFNRDDGKYYRDGVVVDIYKMWLEYLIGLRKPPPKLPNYTILDEFLNGCYEKMIPTEVQLQHTQSSMLRGSVNYAL